MIKHSNMFYNKEEWDIQGKKSTGYRFLNKKTSELQFVPGIIGFYQLSSYSFLFFYRKQKHYKVSRTILDKGLLNIVYEHEFVSLEFLTNDLILFDSNIIKRSVLYSISRNREISLNFITHSSKQHDLQLCSKRTIKLLRINEENFPKYLEVNFKLFSKFCTEHIQAIIDVSTLTPKSPVFSTLRNSYLPLRNEYSLKRIIDEDTKYLEIIESFLDKSYMVSSEELLNHITKSS